MWVMLRNGLVVALDNSNDSLVVFNESCVTFNDLDAKKIATKMDKTAKEIAIPYFKPRYTRKAMTAIPIIVSHNQFLLNHPLSIPHYTTISPNILCKVTTYLFTGGV